MTTDDILNDLAALAHPSVPVLENRRGVVQFGVRLGDLRGIAKHLKTNTALARTLWATGNLDAQLLAVLLIKPAQLTAPELAEMVDTTSCAQLADWLNGYVLKLHPDRETLRLQWLNDKSASKMQSRAAWSLTNDRIQKTPQGIELAALLDRIEAEMPDAPRDVQWTMNMCLGNIGIHHKPHRERAVSIGERLGIFRDYPTPRGCTSPFVPLWVAEMVRRTDQV